MAQIQEAVGLPRGGEGTESAAEAKGPRSQLISEQHVYFTAWISLGSFTMESALPRRLRPRGRRRSSQASFQGRALLL